MEAAQLSRNEKTMRRGKGKKKVREPCNPKKKKGRGRERGERRSWAARERHSRLQRARTGQVPEGGDDPAYLLRRTRVPASCCTGLPNRPVYKASKSTGTRSEGQWTCHPVWWPTGNRSLFAGAFSFEHAGGRPSVTRQFPIWSVIPLFPSILNHRGSIFTGRDPSLQEGRTKSSSVWRVQTDALVPRRSALAIPLVEGQL